MEDKRRSVRVKSKIQGTCHKGDALLLYGAHIKNISETGVCAQLKQYLMAGTVLDIEIRLDDSQRTFKGTARVVWIVNKRTAGFPFEAGLEFIEFSSQARIRIARHVAEQVARGEEADGLPLKE